MPEIKDRTGLVEFDFVITKASFDPTTGKRRFRAVASDTEKDSYQEKMSLELFNDFIDRAARKEQPPEKYRSNFWQGGMPYLSVAHYFDLEGKGAAGTVTELFVHDGKLKAKGEFYDTPIGIAAFNAIKKSLGDNPFAEEDSQKKIRISIAFLDYGHQHANYPPFYRKAGTNVPCPYCERRIGDVQYLRGLLIHLALTRVPVNERTDITGVEVSKSMGKIRTREDDAASIVGEELASELEKESRLVGKSETVDDMVVVKSDEPEVAPVAEVVEDSKKKKDEKPVDPEEAGETAPDNEKDEAISKRPDANPKEGEKKYGDVTYADETNKKYPIDTEEHIRAAWNYINKEGNASKYSPEEVKAIKAKIVSAWKKKIDPAGPPSAEEKKSETAFEKLESKLDELIVLMSKPKGLPEKPAPAADTGMTDLTAEQEDADEEAMDAANMPSQANPGMSDQSNADMKKYMQYMKEHPALMKSMMGFMDAFNAALQQGHRGEEMLRQIQQPYTELGEAIKSCVDEMSKKTPKDMATPVANSLTVEDIRKAMQEALTPLSEKVGILEANLSALKQASSIPQPSAAAVPVQAPHRALSALDMPAEVRSNLQNPIQNDPSKPMSLKAIARRSAGLEPV